MSERDIITLADSKDAYHFRSGDTVSLVCDGDTWRLARWRDRVRWWLRDKLRLGVRSEVVSVDNKRGVVRLRLVKWSWLRMRWMEVL